MSGSPVVSFAGAPQVEPLVDALAVVVNESSHRRFVLAGGLGVMARLASAARATNDIDAVTSAEEALVTFVEQLDGAGSSDGHLTVNGVRFDVLGVDANTAWSEIAEVDDDEQRLFVASHLWCLTEATPMMLTTSTSTVEVPVASARALLMMKLGAYRSVHRKQDKRPSDALDVYLLLSECYRLGAFTGPVPAPIHSLVVSTLTWLSNDASALRGRIVSGNWGEDVDVGLVVSMCGGIIQSLGR